MSEATAKGIFLSYAREDAGAARRIAEALRASGLEVWFDENELRGGDAWDAKIRRQIRECALFLPVISATTQGRPEGYFRREWKLAVERSGDMAAGIAFIVPVVVDETREADAVVPEDFMRVQWTRMPGALPTPQFVEHVRKLLASPRSGAAVGARTVASTPAAASPTKKPFPTALAVSLGVVAVSVGVVLFVTTRRPAPAAIEAKPAAPPPKPAPEVKPDAVSEKSIAVLPFADLSADKGGEYFSDGVSEELLNVLAKVPGLRVAARTSAFFFKGKNLPIPEIAAQLNVAYVVEGSVQRAGERVKITAQLIKAADGFHVWSDTFTRDAKDVFAVQEEIAGLITQQLSLKLGVSSVAATAAVNPEAFELFVQARMAWNQRTTQAYARAEEMLNRALVLDPNFARARALLALVWAFQAADQRELGMFGQRDSPAVARIQAEIDRALVLDPNLAEAHTAQGYLYWLRWRTEDAVRELGLAIRLNPNNATAYQFLGRRLLSEGRLDEAETAMRRATELDPLSHRILDNYFIPLSHQNRYAEALVVVERALALKSDSYQAKVWKALCLSYLDRHDEAMALMRTIPWTGSDHRPFIATVLARAGLQHEAEKVLTDTPADSHARMMILARLGRPQEALAAMNPAKTNIAATAELLYSEIYDPIRSDPRFVNFIATLGLTEAHARAQAWRAAHPPKTK